MLGGSLPNLGLTWGISFWSLRGDYDADVWPKVQINYEKRVGSHLQM